MTRFTTLVGMYQIYEFGVRNYGENIAAIVGVDAAGNRWQMKRDGSWLFVPEGYMWHSSVRNGTGFCRPVATVQGTVWEELEQ